MNGPKLRRDEDAFGEREAECGERTLGIRREKAAAASPVFGRAPVNHERPGTCGQAHRRRASRGTRTDDEHVVD